MASLAEIRARGLGGVLAGLSALLPSACLPDVSPKARVGEPWRFSDQSEIRAVSIDRSQARPGGYIRLTLAGSWGPGLQLGFAAGQEAAYEGYPQVRKGAARRGEQRWWTLSPGQTQAELPIPAHWQHATVTVLARLCERPKREPKLEFVGWQGSTTLATCGAKGPWRAVLSGARQASPVPGGPLADRAVLGVAKLGSSAHHLEARYSAQKIEIDGRLDEAVWAEAGHLFVDSLRGETQGVAVTRAHFAWDEEALYIAATLRDEDLWAPHQHRDDPLYRKEAFEVFVGADGSGEDYIEWELSAAGVVWDARFKRYREADKSYDGPFAYAVVRDGTLNDPSDKDQGWSLELAMPWKALCEVTRLVCPLTPGAVLRVNLFRLEMPDRKRQRGSALIAVRKPDFHAMSKAAYLHLQPSGPAGDGSLEPKR